MILSLFQLRRIQLVLDLAFMRTMNLLKMLVKTPACFLSYRAYAVSIHKAQGLEYDSVKVIIPRSNSEKITHGIFYTAITRAKKKLKIFWSTEIMDEIVAGFTADENEQKSLDIIRKKLLSES